MYDPMHDTKIAIIDASYQKWLPGCLVISESDVNTIWVFDVEQLKSPMMKDSAIIANQAIEKMQSET